MAKHPAIIAARLFICPICQAPLAADNGDNASNPRFCCRNNHSFDLAKQGYLNLLPVQQKRSKAPGDDKSMVQARHSFLQAGYYEPLAKRISQLILSNPSLNESLEPNFLDAGCGEGYYSEFLLNQWHSTYPDKPLSAYGMDISKPAIQAACRRSKQVYWSVASLKAIPLQAHCIDLALSVFAPIPHQSLQRVLKQDGLLLVISAGNNHLESLKRVLYDETPNFAEDKIIRQLGDEWDLLKQEKLAYAFQLEQAEAIQTLCAMTPHFWRVSPAKKAQLSELATLRCEADFLITLWRKKHHE